MPHKRQEPATLRGSFNSHIPQRERASHCCRRRRRRGSRRPPLPPPPKATGTALVGVAITPAEAAATLATAAERIIAAAEATATERVVAATLPPNGLLPAPRLPPRPLPPRPKPPPGDGLLPPWPIATTPGERRAVVRIARLAGADRAQDFFDRQEAVAVEVHLNRTGRSAAPLFSTRTGRFAHRDRYRTARTRAGRFGGSLPAR